MELVASKYKKTEIGIIPNEWSLKSYGEIFDFLSTASYSRAETTEIGEILYIHYGDIHTKWKFFLDLRINTLPKIGEDQLKKYTLLKEGDVIVADASEDYAGIGKSVEVKNLGINRAIAGLHTFLLRDRNGECIDGFKGYLHANSLIKKQFDKLATGLKVYGLSRNKLKTVLIPLPPKSEQTAIATVLSDTDALINNLEKLIAKKRNIKQGAMQELLKPKEGWEVKKLGELVNFWDGKRKPIKDTDRAKMKGIYPYYGASGIIDYVNDFLFDEELILLGEDGENILSRNQKLAFRIKGKVWVNNHAHVLKPKKGIDIGFLTEKLESLNYEEYNSGTAQPKLNQKICSQIPITIPIKEGEQKNISSILSEMDAEITSLETKLEKYRKIKQGMMQNLLTGKIRLV